MDRRYKASEKVAVLNKDGTLKTIVKRVPYSFQGFDNYKYQGVIYKGYFNRDKCLNGIQAFIQLTE